jgi:hypothetical protein
VFGCERHIHFGYVLFANVKHTTTTISVQSNEYVHMGDSYSAVEIEVFPMVNDTPSDFTTEDHQRSVDNLSDCQGDAVREPGISSCRQSAPQEVSLQDLKHYLPSSGDQSNEETLTSIPETLQSASKTLSSLLKESREYSLELTPKVLYCSGDIVNLLIKTQVGHYLEFKPVERILLVWDKTIEAVSARLY